ncbi:hypothetical protein A4A49_30795 [Nicotiana attenuata]|uniref:Uncharacterized protein n=1 Tax=Nicotiana attenuata TaxID=49451 RepID=A0A1J6IZX1_NICAT|nr:hypothetical protein A4A49_30795 [Nicotiana attenuata]
MAPNKKDISKIGQEAFALLDEQRYGRKGRPSIFHSSSAPVKTTHKNWFYYQNQPQTSHVVQFKPAYAVEERVINSHEAVQLHGGVLICDYSKRKSKSYSLLLSKDEFRI